LNVFPVPAEDILNINFTSQTAQRMSIRMTNTLGQVAVEEQLGVVSGQRNIALNTSELASGVYLLSISNGTTIQSVRVTVK